MTLHEQILITKEHIATHTLTHTNLIHWFDLLSTQLIKVVLSWNSTVTLQANLSLY